jgi:hypothetical protein
MGGPDGQPARRLLEVRVPEWPGHPGPLHRGAGSFDIGMGGAAPGAKSENHPNAQDDSKRNQHQEPHNFPVFRSHAA